jgi:hypothetical protein
VTRSNDRNLRSCQAFSAKTQQTVSDFVSWRTKVKVLAPRAGEGCLYSPSCREQVFSETELPLMSLLGNSDGVKRAGAPRFGALVLAFAFNPPSFAGKANILVCGIWQGSGCSWSGL